MSDTGAVSSGVVLVLFLAIVYAVILAARKVNASTDKATASLGSKGVTYEDGTIKVKTSMAPVSREQQVKASADAANAAARHVLDHKEAFSVGGGDAAASASGVDTPTRGFRRTKKLAD